MSGSPYSFLNQLKTGFSMFEKLQILELPRFHQLISDVSKETTLAGWVQTVRKFGAITFVDLRDRYGITQLLFGEELN
eukprot:gene58935-80705_t